MAPSLASSQKPDEVIDDIVLSMEGKAGMQSEAPFDVLLQLHEQRLTKTMEELFEKIEVLIVDMRKPNPLEISPSQQLQAYRQITPGGDTPSQGDASRVTKPSRTSFMLEEEDMDTTWSQWLGKEAKPTWWQIPLRRMVSSWMFESMFAFAIFTNSIFIAVQVEMTANSPGRPPDRVLFFIASVYTLLFTVEFCLRVTAFGPRVFCGEDWCWMLLDVCVVFSSLLEFALELQMHQEDSSSNAFSNMRLLRVLRVAKVTRALRIVRVVKFVRSLKSLLFCIGRTLRALAWSLVLLMLIVFVFGLIFTDITSEYLTQTDTVVDPITAGTLRTRFGGLELSMHTLYGSITGGFTWVEARDAFGEISFVWGILFEGYISFCLFAVLNVMTGVFCHSAIESADKDHEMNLQILATEREKYFRAVKRLFARLDADADGGITATEFEVALQDKTLISVFDALEISVEDAWNLFRTLDSDGDSHVGPQEFIDGCLRLKGPARSIDVVCIKRDLNTLMQKLDTQVEEMTHIKKKITRAD
mmetsp:Transcript_47285/g.96300  ORF Transcript_47285/g.96300 Transcript_47285/m.96300 type:complete len:530 (+) Transcript_47285:31-1620(+)